MKRLFLFTLSLFIFSCDSQDDAVYGCTDTGACNYDPSATHFNQTCEYPDDDLDCNGNCLDCELCSWINNCVECTDESACNYNPNATLDEGCAYTIDICGICGGGDHNPINGYYCADLDVLDDMVSINSQINSECEDINDIPNNRLGWDIDTGRLTWLDSYGCNLTNIPENIGNLEYLNYLYLGNNQLENLPDNITTLDSLEELYLYYNNLTSLPDFISTMSALKYLYIDHNNLTTLPDDLCNLPNIIEIYVGGNNLCEQYHYDCITDWGPQDQSNCCEGVNDEGETIQGDFGQDGIPDTGDPGEGDGIFVAWDSGEVKFSTSK